MRHTARNFFAAATLDRASARRLDAAWLQARLDAPQSRVVPVWRQRSLVVLDDEPRAVTLPLDVLDPGRREALVFLGEASGTAFFALGLEGDEAEARALAPAGADYHELRDVGGLLGEDAGSLLAYARAITFWHRRHRHCGECGRPTRSEEGGHLRVCVDGACGAKHFPRTDPAVIVLVTHGEGAASRCLLGRPPGWVPGLYSTLAGFVEPGETLEGAVVREIREEAGVVVDAVTYHSSQPWPFPSSLMLGFTARAVEPTVQLDADEELEDARWFSRDELASALTSGELRLPRRISIAFRLIESWYDADQPGALGALLESLPPR
ncbi:MAG: NAD(+) diphosphatase [Ectothiorhodospiraceae bacterium]|nr:NAD(+) diphosphatase [Chromatiales bacterium]MCP5155743.1 NAD(+) diphosphatase [Ectothiorhodospiraceae bacterium]